MKNTTTARIEMSKQELLQTITLLARIHGVMCHKEFPKPMAQDLSIFIKRLVDAF